MRGYPFATAVATLVMVAGLTLGGAASGAPSQRVATAGGGTLRVASPIWIRRLDPALSGPLAWQVLNGTCATLMAPGEPQRPEAAAGPPRISRDGRTYVFTVRPGLRFSDGSPVTAANFAHGLGRVLNPAMRSEAAAIYADVERVSSQGRRLRIELKKPRGDLLVRLSLPNACPVPLGLPVDPTGIAPMVGSGPYYISRLEPFEMLVLERNRHYRGPRPARIDRLVYTTSGELEENIRAVEEGRADVLGIEIPSDVRVGLARRYGVNRHQLFRQSGTFTGALVLNTSRPLLRGNVALRKAINLALDRPELVRQYPGGVLSRTPTDQILPSEMAGWADHRLYPLAGPHLQRARSLAEGNLRGGKAVLYISPGEPGFPGNGDVIVRNLRAIGLDVEVRVLAVEVINAKAGVPGEPYDMIFASFFPEYPDPASQIARLLGGENARKSAANTNFAYFDNPIYNRRITAANALSGEARYRAFSKLDADIMRKAAPWAPIFEGSSWLFVSRRVGCVEQNAVVRLAYWAVCLG